MWWKLYLIGEGGGKGSLICRVDSCTLICKARSKADAVASYPCFVLRVHVHEIFTVVSAALSCCRSMLLILFMFTGLTDCMGMKAIILQCMKYSTRSWLLMSHLVSWNWAQKMRQLVFHIYRRCLEIYLMRVCCVLLVNFSEFFYLCVKHFI